MERIGSRQRGPGTQPTGDGTIAVEAATTYDRPGCEVLLAPSAHAIGVPPEPTWPPAAGLSVGLAPAEGRRSVQNAAPRDETPPAPKAAHAGRSVAAPPGQARRRPGAEGGPCWMLSRGPAGTSPTEARRRRRPVLDAQSRPRRDKPDGGPARTSSDDGRIADFQNLRVPRGI